MKSCRCYSKSRLPCHVCFSGGNLFSVQLARRIKLYDGAVWSEPSRRWPVRKALRGAKPAIFTASLGNSKRLLPMAVCRDPPAPQELILLCLAEQVWTEWNEEEMAVPALPGGSRLLCTLTFSSLRRFCIVIPHHPLLDQRCAAEIGKATPLVWFGRCKLCCVYWAVCSALQFW